MTWLWAKATDDVANRNAPSAAAGKSTRIVVARSDDKCLVLPRVSLGSLHLSLHFEVRHVDEIWCESIGWRLRRLGVDPDSIPGIRKLRGRRQIQRQLKNPTSQGSTENQTCRTELDSHGVFGRGRSKPRVDKKSCADRQQNRACKESAARGVGFGISPEGMADLARVKMWRALQFHLQIRCTAALIRAKCRNDSSKLGMARRRSPVERTVAAMRYRFSTL